MSSFIWHFRRDKTAGTEEQWFPGDRAGLGGELTTKFLPKGKFEVTKVFVVVVTQLGAFMKTPRPNCTEKK